MEQPTYLTTLPPLWNNLHTWPLSYLYGTTYILEVPHTYIEQPTYLTSRPPVWITYIPDPSPTYIEQPTYLTTLPPALIYLHNWHFSTCIEQPKYLTTLSPVLNNLLTWILCSGESPMSNNTIWKFLSAGNTVSWRFLNIICRGNVIRSMFNQDYSRLYTCYSGLCNQDFSWLYIR